MQNLHDLDCHSLISGSHGFADGMSVAGFLSFSFFFTSISRPRKYLRPVVAASVLPGDLSRTHGLCGHGEQLVFQTGAGTN